MLEEGNELERFTGTVVFFLRSVDVGISEVVGASIVLDSMVAVVYDEPPATSVPVGV